MACCSATCKTETCRMSRRQNRRSHLPFDVEEYRRGEFTFPNPFIMPQVQLVNKNLLATPDRPFTCQGSDLMRLENLDNPLVIFGQPFAGKTCLFMKLITKANDFYGPQHWIRLVDMVDMAKLLHTLPRRPKDFMELLAIHLKLAVPVLKELFKPLPNAKELVKKREFEKLVNGELFLDGFDEISPSDREYFLRLLPQTRRRRDECPIRIWIGCRSYLKEVLLESVGDLGAFEILSYIYRQQMDLLYFRWRDHFPNKLTSEQEDKLWDFTQVFYSQLQLEICNFENTLGAVPIFVDIIGSTLKNHAVQFVEGSSPVPYFSSCSGICLGELVDCIVLSMIECHCLKQGKPLDAPTLDKEYKRIVKMYCRFAIETFPQYECDPAISQNLSPSKKAPCTDGPGKKSGRKSKGQSETTEDTKDLRGVFQSYYRPSVVNIPEELFRVGLLIKDHNNVALFHHKILGDFFIGRYFAIPDSLAIRDKAFDGFFLRVLLFDAEAKTARSFLDSFLYSVPQYQPRILHDFIIQHYRLSRSKRSEWKRMRDDGNVWHLLIMEGHHRLAEVIIEAFCLENEKEEVRQLLRMRVPIDIYEGKANDNLNDLLHVDKSGKHRHLVSSLGVLALFGYSHIVRETINHFLTIYDIDEIRRMFNQRDTWTPIHYAAMHSNLWFVLQVYGTSFHKKIGIKPGIYNPAGKLSTHLLMSHSWFHVMVLKDHFFPEYDELTNCLSPCGTTSPAKSKGKGNKKGGKCNGKRQKSKEMFAPPQPMVPCCVHKRKDEEHMHYREVVVYRDMVKTLMQGNSEGNMYSLVHHSCMEFLVRNGREDINARDRGDLHTVLHYAVLQGNLDTVKLLIKLNANVAVVNRFGRTPLHHAGMFGHRRIFICLVNNGAKAIQRDDNGVSAIQLWKSTGEAVDEANKDRLPMTVSERQFFKICYEMDTLMDDICLRDERQKAEEEEKLFQMENDLNDIMNLGQGERVQVGDEGEVSNEDMESEEEEDEEGSNEDFSDANGKSEDGPSESENDSEEPSNEQTQTTTSQDENGQQDNNGAGAHDVDSDNDDDNEQNGTDDKCRTQTGDKERSRVEVMKLMRKCVGKHFSLVKDDKEFEGGQPLKKDEESKEARAEALKTLQLQFVGDDGQPVVPSEQVYDDVVNHLSKLLEFQRILLLPGHRGISSEPQPGPSRRVTQHFKSIRRQFK